MPPPPMIVFSDLDGTLLDHTTYSFAAAQPALSALAGLGVPVILASSKTAAEVGPLRKKMGLQDYPAIVENGAGLLGAGCAATPPTDDYAALRSALAAVNGPFEGFGDWGPDRIAQETGLPAADAALAAQRTYSEPGLWRGADAELELFLARMKAHGFSARQGGRYLTFSRGATKADQISAVLERYAHPFSVALGDAPNDVEMLEHADLGIVIANPHRRALPPLRGEETGAIWRTDQPGPEGWNTAILRLLCERGLN